MALNKLNVQKVKTLDKPGRYGDGGGLYLIVDPLKPGNLTPTKRWSFRFMKDGKARETGLGGLGAVSLADARKKAQDIRDLIASGRDPLAEKKREKVLKAVGADTFGVLAKSHIKAQESGWRSDKHAAQWSSTLETYCQHIWNMRVGDIEVKDIVAVLEPIWQSKPETARRVRGRVEAVLDFARVNGFTDEHRRNPAQLRGNLDLVMAKQKKKPGHHAALPREELPQFMAQLRLQKGVSPRALEFAILTAARSGEVRGAQWSEIDFEKKLWSIPALRMKAERDHVVPLCDRAIELLLEMNRLRVDNFVFYGQKENTGVSDMTLSAVLKRMKMTNATVHGFRSTFRDWVFEETTHDHIVAELALAHVVGSKTELAYRRGDAMVKRTALMNDWAKYCGSRHAEVSTDYEKVRENDAERNAA